ncbi:MAG TPA: F0F1 ATP synthase subunit B [Nitrospiria bacterium]|jgi:F-type H+-transporting ATPase subunit b|nr:F0F1 ATP synthase subunit B [Nitrospiria bacterium]
MPQFDTHFLSPLLFWSIVSFGILLYLLKRFALPGVLEMLELREKKIKDSLDQADRLKQEAHQLLSQYEAKLKSVHEEGRAILEKARMQAQHQLEENERRMEQETQRMLAEARSEIQRDQQQALQEIQRTAVDLTLLAAEKVLARSLTDADHRRLVDEAVREITPPSKR